MTDENNAAPSAASNGQNEGPQFALQRIYLKDMSFESPQGLDIFKKQWQPKINQEMNTTVNQLEDGLFEVILKITIEAKMEEKTAFLVEVHQAGIFLVKGFEDGQLAQLLNTSCPQLLFPYAREAIDNCAVRGSFPAVNIPPVNFEALYMHAMEQAKQQQASAQAQ